MSRFVSFSLSLAASGLMLICSADAQSVTTWHNDKNRTGLQSSESFLTATGANAVSQTNFGLLWQYTNSSNTIAGQVYAQPLAVANVPSLGNAVFIATEEDMLYAFDTDSLSNTALWTANLAAGNSYVDCNNLQPPCGSKGVISPYIGVTGTPVISTSQNAVPNVLYAVSANQLSAYPHDVQYYLHAIDITSGREKTGSPIQITASATGAATTPADCQTATASGTVQFDPHHHIQRAGLLLLTLSNGGTNTDVVYIAFAPVYGETQNGWILGYTYTQSGFTQVPPFITTPYGTGGGIWESGAGLASDGTYIYAPTANGTFDVYGVQNLSTDYGDSMLKLAISTSSNNFGALSVSDYFAPSDVLTFQPLVGSMGPGRCINDEDFGSGGVLLIPDAIITSHPHAMISAEKESDLWLLDRDSLGGLNGSGLVQMIQQPAPSGQNAPGYWSSPAYWKYVDSNNNSYYQLYFAPDETTTSVPPYPISMYALTSSGLASGPYPKTPDVFCALPHAPTPAISSNGTAPNTGILWAIESSSPGNPGNCSQAAGPAVLHAYNATPASGTLSSLYTSSGLSQHLPGKAVNFPTPTIFNGRVYMGTKSEVDVFGLCSSQMNGCLQ